MFCTVECDPTEKRLNSNFAYVQERCVYKGKIHFVRIYGLFFCKSYGPLHIENVSLVIVTPEGSSRISFNGFDQTFTDSKNVIIRCAQGEYILSVYFPYIFSRIMAFYHQHF